MSGARRLEGSPRLNTDTRILCGILVAWSYAVPPRSRTLGAAILWRGLGLSSTYVPLPSNGMSVFRYDLNLSASLQP